MPKLFWKLKNEDLLQISRPTTRSGSPGTNIYQFQEPVEPPLGIVGSRVHRRGSNPTPDLIRVEASNFPLARSFQSALPDSRSPFNNHIGEPRNQDPSESETFNGFHFPDDIHSDRLRNDLNNRYLSVNGTGFYSPKKDVNRSLSDTPRLGINGQEVDIEDDLTKMAAQRDQQRGTRYIRGMMAPVIISKDNDGRHQEPQRWRNILKQRSESVLDYNVGGSPDFSIREGSNNFSHLTSSESSNFGDTLSIRKLHDFSEGRGPRKRQPMDDSINGFGNRDIMAQSIRRQTLKGKPNLFSDEILYGSRLSTGSLGAKTPNDFTILRSEKPSRLGEEDDEVLKSSVHSKDSSNTSREDIQILNLHGFMDGHLRGRSAAILIQEPPSKRKSRRRYLRRLEDISPIDANGMGSRHKDSKLARRRGKLSRSRKGEGDDEDVVLKDIDDVDEKISNLVIGPKQSFKGTVGQPVTFDEVLQIRQLLTGNPVLPLTNEWLNQNFTQNKNPNLSYGLLQKKGGPCGVLACVQSHIMKSLMFGSRLSPTTSPASPLRPSTREWVWALGIAITEILWRISDSQKAILALPGSFPHFSEQGIGRYTPDGLTETLTLHEFTSVASLLAAVEGHIQVFTSEASSGVVLLLYSALLTRGLDKVSLEMDAGGNYLINSHGYASQEVVNLMLTGQATTNTFDGDHTFGVDGPTPVPPSSSATPDSIASNDLNLRRSESLDTKMILRGIKQRAEIGLLSLFEHYGSCKVGTHLKSPEYPVWVVCSESHYSVLFGRDQMIARDEYPSDPFDVYFYDGLALQEDEIRLTIDVRKDPLDAALIPPLELCLRTKWPKAFITWNGSDPIL